MPGEAYRDPLASAEARIAQLETKARWLGIPLVFDRSPSRPFSWATLGVLTAALVILFGILEVRLSAPPRAIESRSLLPDSRSLPRTLAWFEPAPAAAGGPRVGPIAAATRSHRLLVGLLWRRGQPVNGLHVAAFDRASLAVQWVSDALPASWISPDSDARWVLSVEGQTIVRLEDRTGSRYAFRLDDGTLIGREPSIPKPTAFQQVSLQDFASVPFDTRVVAARGERGFDLHIGDLIVPVPNTSAVSRLRSVWQIDELVFVLVDDTLHVFDGSNGFHRGILEAP